VRIERWESYEEITDIDILVNRQGLMIINRKYVAFSLISFTRDMLASYISIRL